MADFELKEFTRVIDHFKDKLVPQQLVQMHRKISLEAMSRIVLKTPVDTGRARANWQTGIGNYDNSTVPWQQQANPGDAAASEVLRATTLALQSLKPFETVWLFNNLEYIEALEHGHSRQAPSGMVGLTVAEMDQYLRTAVIA